MYTKRLQLINYGPIERLDIEFPFSSETPRPIVFVGENGSGKSIVLSHIVNGLLLAKSVVFPDTPEVNERKVFKIRSSSYITAGAEASFSQVDFEDGFNLGEVRAQQTKESYPTMPSTFSSPDAERAWNSVKESTNDSLYSNIEANAKEKLQNLISTNCILYFPANRFEEPAWLNHDNLRSKAEYTNLKHMAGHTDRTVMNYSPLRDIQTWLFELAYDRAAFEMNTVHAPNLAIREGDSTYSPFPGAVPIFLGYRGPATQTYELVLTVIRKILKLGNTARLGIGVRSNRVVSIIQGEETLVPNVFHLSSGETALISLFLSILRDFDYCNVGIEDGRSIRGTVVIDEIDLHLHSSHQHEVLPSLISLFPNVQFVITTHSPLFVLGLNRVLGEHGFDLYLLPHGVRIDAEEFGDFKEAYHAFCETRRYLTDFQAAVESADRPIVFVDGATDVKYLTRASALLGFQHELDQIELRAIGGDGNLRNAWKGLKTSSIRGLVRRMVVLLHDCDSSVGDEDGNNVFRRKIPLLETHPIGVGTENLLSRQTMEKAIMHKSAFVDIDPARTKTVRGENIEVPERWTINGDEKTNLCNWICENCVREDFEGFKVVFNVLKDIPGMFEPPK